MTKRDYVLIADALKATKPIPEGNGYLEKRALFHAIVDAMTDRLARENPRFDRVKFFRFVFGMK